MILKRSFFQGRWLYYFYGLALVFALVQIFATGIGTDTKTLLHYSIYLLRDGDLYTHRFEVNPPLIMLLYTLPAWLILHGMPPAIMLHGMTFLGCLFSLWLLHRELLTVPMEANRRCVWMGAATLLLVMLPPFFPVSSDREHWLFIFALPWLILSLLGQRASTMAICLAGIGFCIKPYNLILALVMILFAGPPTAGIRARLFSRTSLLIGSVAGIYGLILFIFFRPYLTEVLPIALLTYKALNMPTVHKVMKLTVYALPSMIVLLASRGPQLGAYLALTIGGMLVFWANGGWHYMDYVLFVPIGLNAAAIVTRELRMWGMHVKEPYIIGWTTLAALLGCAFYGLYLEVQSYRVSGYSRNYTNLPGYLEKVRQAAGDRFILLSTTLWGSTVAPLNGPPYYILSYDYLGPVPWLVANPDAPGAAYVRQSVSRAIITALKENPTLLIDESWVQRGLPLSFDLKTFVEQDPEVKTVLSHYHQTDTIGVCSDVYWNVCHFSVWHAATAP